MGYGGGGYGGGYGGGGGRQGGGAFQKKEGAGKLFPERNKRNNQSPDFGGYVMHQGQEIRISGWWGKDGQSLNLKVKTGNRMAPLEDGYDGNNHNGGFYPQQPQHGGYAPQQPYGGQPQYGAPAQPQYGYSHPQQPQPGYSQAPNAVPFQGPRQGQQPPQYGAPQAQPPMAPPPSAPGPTGPGEVEDLPFP